eukprot:CAMPEP_0197242848 /NCGR_PEP_ID=MMETSP1429-20130617/8472_1 /TAXON_ID=49237 /ORGANISM="Chaetoceros  sp., Strain UNC1202" /LENGTH=258 /DNA_ID=CAMNT_0042702949 /DNA_START=20 /DNA_END=796 /DNA_ORIENTATION=+
MKLNYPSSLSSSSSDEIYDPDNLRRGLSLPTDERPQIKPPTGLDLQSPQSQASSMASTTPSFPSSSTLPSKNKKNGPIMEGMVYMMKSNSNSNNNSDNNDERPDPTDVIVLTLASSSQPGTVLAGAKIPMYKTRMPFNFQFYPANILKGREGAYEEAVKGSTAGINKNNGDGKDVASGDFIVTARVCPENSKAFPCTAEESTYEARGVSKFLQVPGMHEGDVVRTAAALPLQRTAGGASRNNIAAVTVTTTTMDDVLQ